MCDLLRRTRRLCIAQHIFLHSFHPVFSLAANAHENIWTQCKWVSFATPCTPSILCNVFIHLRWTHTSWSTCHLFRKQFLRFAPWQRTAGTLAGLPNCECSFSWLKDSIVKIISARIPEFEFWVWPTDIELFMDCGFRYYVVQFWTYVVVFRPGHDCWVRSWNNLQKYMHECTSRRPCGYSNKIVMITVVRSAPRHECFVDSHLHLCCCVMDTRRGQELTHFVAANRPRAAS